VKISTLVGRSTSKTLIVFFNVVPVLNNITCRDHLVIRCVTETLHRHLLHLHFLVTCVEFPFPTANASCKQPFLQLGGSKSHVCSRSIYNLKINTISTYHTPFDRVFLQLSNGIRHVMPSTDRKLELQAKYIDVSTVWQPAVCSNGLK